MAAPTTTGTDTGAKAHGVGFGDDGGTFLTGVPGGAGPDLGPAGVEPEDNEEAVADAILAPEEVPMQVVPGSVFSAPLVAGGAAAQTSAPRAAAEGQQPAKLRRAVRSLRHALGKAASEDVLPSDRERGVGRSTLARRVKQRPPLGFKPKLPPKRAHKNALSELESALDAISARTAAAEADPESAINVDQNMSTLVQGCERVVDALG